MTTMYGKRSFGVQDQYQYTPHEFPRASSLSVERNAPNAKQTPGRVPAAGVAARHTGRSAAVLGAAAAHAPPRGRAGCGAGARRCARPRPLLGRGPVQQRGLGFDWLRLGVQAATLEIFDT